MPETKTQDQTLLATCQECSKRIRVPASYAGRKGRCPRCKAVVRIPGQRRSSSEERSQNRRASVSCPRCTKPISSGALKCRHCKEWLNQGNRQGGLISRDTYWNIKFGLGLAKIAVVVIYVVQSYV